MQSDSLNIFATTVADAWGPISTELVGTSSEALVRLVAATPGETWLDALLSERPAARELYRDPHHGFVLLAHTEKKGLYRPPHDHGRAWVVYAVQSGELQISTYGRETGPDGTPRLVKRDTTVLSAGQARAYLPGDVHDTCCLSETALLFRFTERDLRHEDQVERKVTRYVQRDGFWIVPA